MKRLEFSDSQKAQIYTRDKGICAFSGKILWVFHYGTSTCWDMDWVDHILPAMKGGDNSIENGICASSFFNSKKRDNSHDNKYLFHSGRPTEYYFHAYGHIPSELSEYLLSMKNIHPTDWYLNRALCSLMIVLDYLYNPYDLKGQTMKRDSLYWSKSSFKKLALWKKKSQDVESFITRLGINTESLSEDQKIMLEIIQAKNENDILNIAERLLPYYKNSRDYFKSLVAIESHKDIDTLSNAIFQNSCMPQRDRAVLTGSIQNFYKPLFNNSN